MNTRQQRYAKAAWDDITRAKGKGPAAAKEYRTLCMKGPQLIQTSGLVQALAFFLGREDHGDAYTEALAQTQQRKDGRELLGVAQKAELTAYMALTREVMAVAVWLRRFAQSEIEPAESDR